MRVSSIQNNYNNSFRGYLHFPKANLTINPSLISSIKASRTIEEYEYRGNGDLFRPRPLEADLNIPFKDGDDVTVLTSNGELVQEKFDEKQEYCYSSLNHNLFQRGIIKMKNGDEFVFHGIVAQLPPHLAKDSSYSLIREYFKNKSFQQIANDAMSSKDMVTFDKLNIERTQPGKEYYI